MSRPITENIIEQSAIEILQSQGWEYAKSNKAVFIINQIRTLTQLRDTLLPKLMSGEVRVS
jgi:hypothetical protein